MPATQVVGPVYPIPAHCPQCGETPPEAVEVDALLLLVVVAVVFELVLFMTVLVLDALLELELPPTTPPGPSRFEIPVFCKPVGSRGSISASQTVSYMPGLPSLARESGSRLPHDREPEQQAEELPHIGPAAQAVQPMYSGLSAM